MWDPAYNGNSPAQQQRHSSDLSTRIAADHDTLPHAAFGAKQRAESTSVQGQGRDPTADGPLARYNVNDDTSDMSYRNGYPAPQSQQPNSGSADHTMRSSSSGEEKDPVLPPSLPSSKEAISLEPPTTQLPVNSTVTQPSHQHQQHHASSNINNIPLEIDTAAVNTSPQSSPSNPLPVRRHSDTQDKIPLQPASSVSPASFNMPPPLQSSASPELHDQPSTPPASAPPLRLPSSKLPRNTRDTSPCIARLTVPPSHMSLFHDALRNPPDPDLKIRKKIVRFNKTSLADSSPPHPHPRSEHRHERRESEGSGSYSTSSKISTSSHYSSSKTSFGKSSVPQIIEKDPEERMAELMELKQMKIRQEDLLHLKDQVYQTGQNLEEKQTILDEVRAERKVLHGELNRYIAMVKQVQKDLELATEAETQLTKERDQLSQYLTQLRDHDFKVLKEEVDQLRAKKGLRPLQSLEQEQEEVMGRYLEERRGQWREDGAPQDPSSPSTVQNTSGSGLADLTAAADTPSRRQGAGSSSRTAAAAGSRTSRSHTSSTTATSSTSRGRDRDVADSRSNKAHHSSSSTHNRNHSSNSVSGSKSKHEQSSSSSSSRQSNSRSSSRRQSSRSRSRSPVASLARDERSKKRSRYAQ